MSDPVETDIHTTLPLQPPRTSTFYTLNAPTIVDQGAYGRVKFQTCVPPANDDFADAQAITGASGTFGPVELSCATVEASEPTGTNLLNPPVHQTVWFMWVAPANGTATFDTDGGTGAPPYVDTFGVFDTTLAVWTGATLGTLVEVASNDDVDQSGADIHFWSEVTFAATSGTTYWVQVGTYDTGYVGEAPLNWSLV